MPRVPRHVRSHLFLVFSLSEGLLVRELSLHLEFDSSLFADQSPHHVRGLVELGASLGLNQTLMDRFAERMSLRQVQPRYLFSDFI
jgi:hypothetical protein